MTKPMNVMAAVRLASAFVLVAGLVGCAQPPKTLYQWDTYQRQVYEYFKGDGTSPGDQLKALQDQAQKAGAAGAALPPGFHAHVAAVYLRLGQEDEARQELEAEKASFPESAPYMDFLLKRMTAAKSPTANPSGS